MLALMLAGCGEKSTAVSESITESQRDGRQILLAETPADLGKCTPADEQFLYYVVSTKSFYACSRGAWLPVDVGNQGKDGVAGKDGVPGKDGVVGPKGEPGPAGKDGVDGVAGPTGPTGPQGTQGPAGTSGSPVIPVRVLRDVNGAALGTFTQRLTSAGLLRLSDGAEMEFSIFYDPVLQVAGGAPSAYNGLGVAFYASSDCSGPPLIGTTPRNTGTPPYWSCDQVAEGDRILSPGLYTVEGGLLRVTGTETITLGAITAQSSGKPGACTTDVSGIQPNEGSVVCNSMDSAPNYTLPAGLPAYPFQGPFTETLEAP
jgi:hypothetical protein